MPLPTIKHCEFFNTDSKIRKKNFNFSRNRKKGEILQHIYNSLITIPPTSVESERAFSSVGILCSKLRTNLSDGTLDALCFLRTYFKNSV